MSDTYHKIYIQYVFSVRDRDCILLPEWRNDLFEYIAGIVRTKGQKPIIVGGYYDHVHLFVGLNPEMSISDLIRDVKNCSSNFINDSKIVRCKFSWQLGYGVFSYSQSQVSGVYDYILNQEAHHRKKTFKEEYFEFLKKFEVEYTEKYLFDWIETK
jgi:REP element-mobilizing transposase RayT